MSNNKNSVVISSQSLTSFSSTNNNNNNGKTDNNNSTDELPANVSALLNPQYYRSALAPAERTKAERAACDYYTSLGDYSSLCIIYRNLLTSELDSYNYWYKLSLSYYNNHEYNYSYHAIRESLVRQPNSIQSLLFASKLCLNDINRIKEAVTYSTTALSLVSENKQLFTTLAYALHTPQLTLNNNTDDDKDKPSKISILTNNECEELSISYSCHVLFGLSCSTYSYLVSTYSNRKQLQKRALIALITVYNMHNNYYSNDYRLLLSLAILYADIRELNLSLNLTRKALSINRNNSNNWLLLILILTAQKKYSQALKATDNAINYLKSINNNDINYLLLIKSKLQSKLQFHQQAILTITELSSIIFQQNQLNLIEFNKGKRLTFANNNNNTNNSSSDRKSTSKTNTITTGAGSTDSNVINNENPELLLQIEKKSKFQVEVLIWLAQLYAIYATNTNPTNTGTDDSKDNANANNNANSSKIDTNNEYLTEAMDCLIFAISISPKSSLADIYTVQSSIQLLFNNNEAAKKHLYAALAINPTHCDSLIALGTIENQSSLDNNKNDVNKSNSLTLAKGYLTSALQVDATLHRAWYELGCVYSQQGKPEQSAEHFLTSLELERTAPLTSFQHVQRIF